MYNTTEPDFEHMKPPTIKTSEISELLNSESDEFDYEDYVYQDNDEKWIRDFLICNDVFAYPVHNGGFYGKRCDDEEVFRVVELDGEKYCAESDTRQVYKLNQDCYIDRILEGNNKDDNYRGILVEGKRIKDPSLVERVLDASVRTRMNPCIKK